MCKVFHNSFTCNNAKQETVYSPKVFTTVNIVLAKHLVP